MTHDAIKQTDNVLRELKRCLKEPKGVRRRLLIAVIAMWLVCITFRSGTAAGEAILDFNRDIRPILSDHCFACHGPDEHDRAAGLRLDTAAGLRDVVTAGDLSASELVRRIVSEEEDEVMPPPDFGKPLTAEQVKRLQDWIEQGAVFQEHWAFVAPTASVPPRIPRGAKNDDRDPIDQLIDRQAEKAGLELNRRADRRSLIRRVTLDLTGLPPSIEQVRAFASDDSPEAYERLVDRLLASPHYGEHMARYWLDLVRFGDTHGLHLDNYREMWPYRDWVIDAFNTNMPFDRFITEQLAGDLLPNPTDDQKIASGFNRLNVTTNEGGSIYDEVFARNVIDRTDAFGTIFLGLTTGCAVCHDHKFDPITAKDYYSLSAFFNSLDGKALDGNKKDHAPVIAVATESQRRDLQTLESDLARIRIERLAPMSAVDRDQALWEQRVRLGKREGVVTPLMPTSVTSSAEVAMTVQQDGSFVVEGSPAEKDTTTIMATVSDEVAPRYLLLQAFADETGGGRVGLSENGNAVLTEISIEARAQGGKKAKSKAGWQPIQILRAEANHQQPGSEFSVDRAIDGDRGKNSGWGVGGHQTGGGREAWFAVPGLEQFATQSSGETKIRIQLRYSSKYPRHQFRHVRLSLSETRPTISKASDLVLGEIHTLGPFPIQATTNAATTKLGPETTPFDAQQVTRFAGREFRWQHRGDIGPARIAALPGASHQSSVILVHQNLVSDSERGVSLLVGSSAGHGVFVNGKQVGALSNSHRLVPFSDRYVIDLKKGSNDLVIRFAGTGEGTRFAYLVNDPNLGMPPGLAAVIDIPADQRTAKEALAVRCYYRELHCESPEWQAVLDEEGGLEATIKQVRESVATTLVWKETAEPREAHILIRGQYDNPGEVVSRATPAFLPPMRTDSPPDRRGLAEWLLAADHPLTSRVAVNRLWQQLFGVGIVKTSEDFGSQGEPPSNRELLDLLAVDFRTHDWDVKRLMRRLLMTNAYQRSAEASPNAIDLDPENRLLARGPRFRMDAEVLRDQALKLSGLLVDKQGGPSVKPPQPSGLWLAVGYSGSNTVRFEADAGEAVYRRSLYTFWKRTSAPPQLSTLDAPSRESCTARRERTNTPLQALLLLNERQYVEAARELGRQLHQRDTASDADDSDSSDSSKAIAEKIEFAFEQITMRRPSATERTELSLLWKDLSRHYANHPDAADDLLGSEDCSPELAAWMVVCNTLLNLDEVLTK